MSKDEEGGTEDEAANIGVGRYPCMPSLVALQQMRNRLHLAYLGKKLMKWTALATGRELRRIAVNLNDVYGDFGEELANCYILLARSRYFYTQLNKIVIEDIQKHAFISLDVTVKPISAGVKCVMYDVVESEYPAYPHLGIEKGGQTIKETKIAWKNLLRKMILILQLRNSFASVDAAHRSATKKANVLQKIIIPKTQETIKYIMLELEELSREELYRIKKVVQTKKKRALRAKPIEPEPVIKKPKPIPPPPPPPPPPEPVIEPEPQPEPKEVCVAEQPSEESESEESVEALYTTPQPCKVEVCKGPEGPLPTCEIYEDVHNIIKTMDFKKIKPPLPRVCDSLQNLLKRTLSEALTLKLQQQCVKSNIDYIQKKSLQGDATYSYSNFSKLCEEIKTKVSKLLYPGSDNLSKERLLKLKDKLTEIKRACEDLKKKNNTTGLSDLLEKHAQVEKRINALLEKQKTLDRNKQMNTLKAYLGDIESVVKHFKKEGLNIPGAEDFILDCKKLRMRLEKQEEPSIFESIKLKFLQNQVANAEDIISGIKKQGIHTRSLEDFSQCCQDFRGKIEAFEKGPEPDKSEYKKVIKTLDQAINLTKCAKEDGFVEKSFDNFIGSCEDTKKYLLERQTSGANPVLSELKKNIENAMDLVNKLKREGLIQDSMTDFMKTCQFTRKSISIYEAPKTRPQDDDECQCEFCVCATDKFNQMVHDYIRSTKRTPMPPPPKHPAPSKIVHSDEASLYSNITEMDSIIKENPSRTPSKDLPTSSKNVRIIDDGVTIYNDKVKEMVKVKTIVNDDGTISEVKEIVTIKIESDDVVKSIASNESGRTGTEIIKHTDPNFVDNLLLEEKQLDKKPLEEKLTEKKGTKPESIKQMLEKQPADKKTSSGSPSYESQINTGMLSVKFSDEIPSGKQPTDKEPTDKTPGDKTPEDKSPGDESPTEEKPKDKKHTNPSSDVAYCTTSHKAFNFHVPIRKVKSESIYVAEPITEPSLRPCISVTIYNHSDLDLWSDSSQDLLINLYLNSETCI